MKRFRLSLLIPLLVAFFAGPAQAQINFGLSTAIGESEVFVGQPQNRSTPGMVYVFTRGLEDNTWSVQAKLTGSDGTNANGFGQSFAVDGGTLAVGAPNQDGGHGALYVFQRDAESGGWQETARLSDDDTTATHNLGSVVAIRGDMLVASAPTHDELAGIVYLFQRDAETGTWTEAMPLMGSGVQAGDLFGASLAIDEQRLLIGAPGRNDGAGVVYAFRYDADAMAWNEEGMMMSSDSTAKGFGVSVQLQGDMALVAAPGITPGTQPDGTQPPGTVFAFAFDAASASWTEQAKIQATESNPMNLFGLSMALDGNQALIGAPGVGQFSGNAFLFERDDMGAWQQGGQWAPEGSGLLLFGLSVATQDGVGIVGMPGGNFGEGSASVFARNDAGEWEKQGDLTPEADKVASVMGEQVNCVDGTAGEYGCLDVDLAAFMPIEAIGGSQGVKVNDIWGWTDPQTDKEYALVGRMDGTAFVDVSDPLNPVFLGDLALTEGANPSTWRDIKVYNNHAYIVADNAGQHGMQVFDLTQLRDVENAPVTFEQTALYDGIASAHNIVINEETGFAFAVGSSGGGATCGGGLHMIDIRTPQEPTFAGCFSDTETGRSGTGYSHDAQCVIYDGPDAEHAGKEICFGSNETALSVADVTDKENPVALSNASYPNVGYSHQGWLTEDHQYFYMNDELDELQGKVDGTRTLVWDVTDLDDPQLVTEYLSDNKASDHNLYIRGNLMYQSNYLSGLRIFDISDVANPKVVGYFDTVPSGEDAPGFGGSWSNYPYFKSGSIIVTSMSEGLFVLKKKAVDI